MFVATSMPIGGAETLLVQLARGLDRRRIAPELCCLKELGPLGEELAAELPAFHGLIRHKYDLAVCGRLARLFRERALDAVVTVGCGDKMFWGRLAAWRAGVPVVASALHSTGWPDGVGWLNRRLTGITDAFIAVAPSHGRYLVQGEGFPPEKVVVIPNGIDCLRFSPQPHRRAALRRLLGIPPDAFVIVNVAALRPEKNHARFLRLVSQLQTRLPNVRAILVGDGPERPRLVRLALESQLQHAVHFAGARSDIPDWLSAADVFLLTSDNEANPVSILEAMGCALPVVASRVGSIADVVCHGVTGYLADPRADGEYLHALLALAGDLEARMTLGRAGRSRVLACGSIDGMVHGYTQLIEAVHARKVMRQATAVVSAWAGAPIGPPSSPPGPCGTLPDPGASRRWMD